MVEIKCNMASILQIKELRDKGLSYKSIGEIFGISRQRVHQILTGYKTPFSKLTKQEQIRYSSDLVKIRKIQAKIKTETEKKRIGRPLMVKEIKMAKKYREMGLTFREIAKLMDRNLAHIYRWVNYELKD